MKKKLLENVRTNWNFIRRRNNNIDIVWLASLIAAFIFVGFFTKDRAAARIVEILGIIYILSGTLYLSGGAYITKLDRQKLDAFVNHPSGPPPLVTESQSREIVRDLFLSASNRQFLGVAGIASGTILIVIPEQIAQGIAWTIEACRRL